MNDDESNTAPGPHKDSDQGHGNTAEDGGGVPKELRDLMAWKDEVLHPDLVPYLVDGPLGRALKHPLVFDPTAAFLPGLANLRYAEKTKALQKALAKHDWNSYIWLHERPHRLEALTFVADNAGLSKKKMADLVAMVWSDSENIWQNLEEWRDLLREFGMRMTPEERQRLQALPADDQNRLTIYRGAAQMLNGDDFNVEGFSWTLDRNRGTWFAIRFRPDLNDDSHDLTTGIQRVIVEGKIRKDRVIALIDARGEHEIVAFPEDVEWTRVAPPEIPERAIRFDPRDGHWWVQCLRGHQHYGENGASGLLLRTDESEPRFFLHHRSIGTDGGHTWAYPGGAIDAGETAWHAALREAVEEGVPSDVVAGLAEPDSSRVRVDDHDGWTYTTHLVAVPLPDAIEFEESVEAGEYDWLTLDEALDLPLHPGVEATLRWAAQRP